MQATKTQDGDGYAVTVLTPITENPIWANVVDQSSKEFYSANSEQREQIIRCNIAYRNDINTGMLVKWRNKDYEIIRIYEGDHRNNFVDLDAKLIEVANG